MAFGMSLMVFTGCARAYFGFLRNGSFPHSTGSPLPSPSASKSSNA